jgi:hypothetical protein
MKFRINVAIAVDGVIADVEKYSTIFERECPVIQDPDVIQRRNVQTLRRYQSVEFIWRKAGRINGDFQSAIDVRCNTHASPQFVQLMEVLEVG